MASNVDKVGMMQGLGQQADLGTDFGLVLWTTNFVVLWTDFFECNIGLGHGFHIETCIIFL